MKAAWSLQRTLKDLDIHGDLLKIDQEIDPYLQAGMIQRRFFQSRGPALLFANVKGAPYPAVANLFATEERCRFLFRHRFEKIQKAFRFLGDPGVLGQDLKKSPLKFLADYPALLGLLPQVAPLRSRQSVADTFDEITLSQIPQIVSWPKDGGAFLTLPQVYCDDGSLFKSNTGMYRIQISGQSYIENEQAGLHYQIHRGMGIFHKNAIDQKRSLKVSVFLGGPPAHTVAAVMPLPEFLPEWLFAAVLAGRNFRYRRQNGWLVSMDADFVILGEVEYPASLKTEGPFGDHLGYYSKEHHFPFLKIHKVYAQKQQAIFPFTTVGRPPQEDSYFGKLIHELTAPLVKKEIPGVRALHAVDLAGVHSLLFAVGSERYTPYLEQDRPMEILTQAHAVLGFNQCSLAKYLVIAAPFPGTPLPDIHDERAFLLYALERIDLRRDLHFHTSTTMDTLDYTGGEINQGSKVVIAVYGQKRRDLKDAVLEDLFWPQKAWGQSPVHKAARVAPGIVAIEAPAFSGDLQIERESTEGWIQVFCEENQKRKSFAERGIVLLILCDDADFLGADFANFLWAVFTRSDPAQDIYGYGSCFIHKHWGCESPLVIDARIKPYMAEELKEDPLMLDKTRDLVKKNEVLDFWIGDQF